MIPADKFWFTGVIFTRTGRSNKFQHTSKNSTSKKWRIGFDGICYFVFLPPMKTKMEMREEPRRPRCKYPVSGRLINGARRESKFLCFFFYQGWYQCMYSASLPSQETLNVGSAHVDLKCPRKRWKEVHQVHSFSKF